MHTQQDQLKTKNYIRHIRGNANDNAGKLWSDHTIEKESVIIAPGNAAVKKVSNKKTGEERNHSGQWVKEAIIAAQEMERSAIGMELHDNVNQVLGAARLYIMAAMKETQLHKDNLLDLASTYVMDAIDEIRNLSRHLVKPSLPSGSLVQALNKLNEDLTRVSSACLHLKIQEINENGLNEPFKLNLFRIVQEQLNNINKHACAKNIDIHLSKAFNEIRLLIADDGRGFDTEKQQAGIGLSNIRSRVKLYEGDMEIVSSPGNGCRLQVTFLLTKSIIKTK